MARTAEQKKEYWAKYSKENREELNKKSRKYKFENRGRILAGQRERYQQNKDEILKKQREWRKNNPDKKPTREQINIWHKKYRSNENNRERERELTRERISKNPEHHKKCKKENCKIWRAKNPYKQRIYNSNYRSKKLNATPLWLSDLHREDMDNIYIESQKLGLTVDHIVPLQGKTVCGLHVPWNLQLLSLSENSIKGNKLL